MRNKTDDPVLINLVFRYSGKKMVLSTGISIPRKYWDANNKRVRENKAFRQHTKINATLKRLEELTLDLHYDYKALGIVPSVRTFRDALRAKIEHRQDEQPGLLGFIKLYIEERRAMNKPETSIKVYQRVLNHLEGYQKARRKNLTFEDITEAFKADFIAYLQAQGLKNNTVRLMLNKLRTFIKNAHKRGIVSEDITKRVKLSIPEEETDNTYLTEREIETLYNMEGMGERLENVRDLFLIGCLTGLRFSDFTQIREENIQQIEHNGKQVECLVKSSKKTNNRVFIPLTNPMLKATLQKHGMKAPKVISSQKLNAYLKELAQLAGFTDEVELNGKVYQKWEKVTSHTARRSFATNAYKRGVPVPDIMKFTGHKTIAAFMKYIKVEGQETAVILSEHDFFTGKSPLKALK